MCLKHSEWGRERWERSGKDCRSSRALGDIVRTLASTLNERDPLEGIEHTWTNVLAG